MVSQSLYSRPTKVVDIWVDQSIDNTLTKLVLSIVGKPYVSDQIGQIGIVGEKLILVQ